MSNKEENKVLNRPTQDEAREKSSFIERIKSSTTSVKASLLLISSGTFILGLLIWIFLRGLETPAYYVMGIGVFIFIIYASLGLKDLRNSLFGRRGKYGFNTTIIFLIVIAILIVGNISIFWATNKTDPSEWLRTDTTATKQFVLEDQVVKILENIKEPIKITAFFTKDTAFDNAALRNTEDLLIELKRRSTKFPLEYQIIDPEIDPTIANEYKINSFPALAIEGTESRRTETVIGLNPKQTSQVFTEQDIVTGLIIVNGISQKKIVFITGHSERDVTNSVEPNGYGLAGKALVRENYILLNETIQELGTRLAIEDPTEIPAVVIIPGAITELLPIEEPILREYAARGGSFVIMLEPNISPDSIKGFLSRFGVAVGQGEAADVGSFVAPNPTFLQVKKSNGQLPFHPITSDFEVLYMPGSTHFAWSVDPETIPLFDENTPVIQQYSLASTSISSWAETDEDIIQFDMDREQSGPLPVSVLVSAFGELSTNLEDKSDKTTKTNIILIGDTDFASNQYFGSANNADLFVNSINWLSEDFELITIRSKTSAIRKLFLTKNELDFVRWSGWLLMPAIISVFGFWQWWRRR